MLNSMHRETGFSLIELLVGVAIAVILFMLGVPSFKNWVQNAQIRTATETIQNGLELARAEAVRRNTLVGFTLTSSVDNTCVTTQGTAAAPASGNWVVSLDDPTGKCLAAKLNEAFPVSDAVNNPAPRIIQTRTAREGSAKGAAALAVISQEVGAVAFVYNGFIIFNGVGRVSANTVAPGNNIQIDISNPTTGGACKPAGPMNCLRIAVSSGGLIRSCNPIWSSTPTAANYDPQGC